MVDANEILVTADASGQVWNMCFWDFSTGTSLRTIKGGVSAPRTLSVISNDYVISAEKNKPIINVWPLQNKVSFNPISFLLIGFDFTLH